MPARWDPPLPDEPPWPVAGDGPFIVLIDAESAIEREVIKNWIERHKPDGVRVDAAHIPAGRMARRRRRTDPALESRLAQDDDPIMIPVRVAWLAQEHDGERRVSIKDVLMFGDPRDPNLLRQRWVRSMHPDRVRIIIAEPGSKSDLETRWNDPTGRGPAEGTSFAEFVALKAWLALERAERALRGARYKVPKFLAEDLFWSRGFQKGVARLAIVEGEPLDKMRKKTGRYLKEIAATHTPFLIDVVTGVMAWVLSLGYRQLVYSAEDLRELYQIGEEHPLVFLPSHKSNFGSPRAPVRPLPERVCRRTTPPVGINMNFFPIGPLLRRSGVFFIRRAVQGQRGLQVRPAQYIDYLLEKTLPARVVHRGWAIALRASCGRRATGCSPTSSTSYRRGLADDVVLHPGVDRLRPDLRRRLYAAEQTRREARRRESFGWVICGSSPTSAADTGRSTSLRRTAVAATTSSPMRHQAQVGRTVAMSFPSWPSRLSNRINDVTPITPDQPRHARPPEPPRRRTLR